MEQLLHYVWKHRLFPLSPLATTDGRTVEVIHPGMHNHDAGPDFFNAKVKIGGQLWVGNVEIHCKSSDWFRHGHDADPAYGNVVLHVVGEADVEVPRVGNVAAVPQQTGQTAVPQQTGQTAALQQQGQTAEAERLIPQLVLPVPDDVRANYERLEREDVMPRCRAVTSALPGLTVHGWMSALLVERLEARMEQVVARRKLCNMDWEATFFITLARTFGFGINGDAMEQWAYNVPLSAVAKHRDDLFQVEAVFFGQAGLLGGDVDVAYFQRLKREYGFLAHKFGLTPMDAHRWRFARLRPQNLPYVRIAQLAMLYCEQRLNFSHIVGAESAEQLRGLLLTRVSEFWQTHYTFTSAPSACSDRRLSEASLNSVIINAVVPVLFSYGRYKGDESLCESALQLLETLPAEDNNVVRAWAQAGVKSLSAADTQALIHLTRNYCEPRNCLRCRFGYEYLRRTPGFLREQADGSSSGQYVNFDRSEKNF